MGVESTGAECRFAAPLLAGTLAMLSIAGHAAINPGELTGPGELYFVVLDSDNQRSYARDLGVTTDQFQPNPRGALTAAGFTAEGDDLRLPADGLWSSFSSGFRPPGSRNVSWAMFAADLAFSVGGFANSGQIPHFGGYATAAPDVDTTAFEADPGFFDFTTISDIASKNASLVGGLNLDASGGSGIDVFPEHLSGISGQADTGYVGSGDNWFPRLSNALPFDANAPLGSRMPLVQLGIADAAGTSQVRLYDFFRLDANGDLLYLAGTGGGGGPAPIPLPPAGWLLLGAVAVALRYRRRAAA